MPKPGKRKFNGTKLRQLRRTHTITKRGMTADELAERIGCNRQAIMRWERGETSPKGESVQAISEFFGVPMESLFYDPETEADTQKLKKKPKKETKKSDDESTRS